MADKPGAPVCERGFLILTLLTVMYWLVACGGVPPTRLPAIAAGTPALDADQIRLRAAAEATIASARSTIAAPLITPIHTLTALPTATVHSTERSTVPPITTKPPQPMENTLNRPITWTAPQQLGRAAGTAHQLLLDRTGRLWAVWEEHPGLDSQSPPTAIRYSIWDGEKWGPMESIPGSDNMVEPAATVLNDGSILIVGSPWVRTQKSGTTPMISYAWFRWDGGGWSSVPDMALTIPLGTLGTGFIASDGYGFVHLVTDPVLLWDGAAWRQIARLGAYCLGHPARDANGNLHMIGTDRNRKAIRHWAWDGKTWADRGAVYVSPDGSSVLPWCPALAAGPDGTLHVAWESSVPPAGGITSREAMPHWLSYSRWNGSEWTAARTLFGPIQASGFWELAIVVLPDGTVVAVWSVVASSESVQLYATSGREAIWTEPTVLPRAPGYTQRGVVAAVDAQGQVHTIWESDNGIYHSLGVR